jgi:hypothetical protein
MRLRRLFRDFGLAEEVIATRPTGYVLPADIHTLDLLEFRHRVALAASCRDPHARLAGLDEALALWTVAPSKGTLLGNVASHLIHRDHVPALVEEWIRTAEMRTDLRLGLDRHRELPADLYTVTAAFPTHERFSAQLMEVLYRCGRQGDALSEYRRIRDRLRQELGTEPGMELRRLEAVILRGGQLPRHDVALPALSLPPRQRTRVGTAGSAGDDVGARGHHDGVPADLPAVPGRLTVRRPEDPARGQSPGLPPDVPHFSGRTVELATLMSRLTAVPRGTAVVVITGPPGIGKSCLAVHLAHRLAGHFDGSAAYLAPSSDAEACEAHAASRTSTARLVVIDDPANCEEVEDRLPRGPGGAAIVVSRDNLSPLAGRRGAFILRLQPLPLHEARALVMSMVVPERIAGDLPRLDDLIRLCGGFPAAMVTAATRLQTSRVGALDDYVRWLSTDPVRRLSTSQDRSLSIGHLVSDHVGSLPPATSGAFLRLAQMAPERLDSAESGVLLDLEEWEAEVVLERLVEANLLEVDSAGRYSMHSLLRAVGGALSGAALRPHDSTARSPLSRPAVHTA